MCLLSAEKEPRDPTFLRSSARAVSFEMGSCEAGQLTLPSPLSLGEPTLHLLHACLVSLSVCM